MDLIHGTGVYYVIFDDLRPYTTDVRGKRTQKHVVNIPFPNWATAAEHAKTISPDRNPKVVAEMLLDPHSLPGEQHGTEEVRPR